MSFIESVLSKDVDIRRVNGWVGGVYGGGTLPPS